MRHGADASTNIALVSIWHYDYYCVMRLHGRVCVRVYTCVVYARMRIETSVSDTYVASRDFTISSRVCNLCVLRGRRHRLD